MVLALDALGIPLRGVNVAAGLGAVALLLGWIGRRRSVEPRVIVHRVRRSRRRLWFLLPVGLGLAAIAIRASLDPLSGFDTVFRWDFLAQQMWRHASLDFYPPVTAEGFQIYGWCDGIPPLVSTLYFWAYLGLGRPSGLATAPVVVGQAALLFVSVWQLAARVRGQAAGDWAAALLATSAVLLWGVAMGQETGLTALALVAMLGYAARHRTDPAAAWPVWAGIAAGVGALAREYGLAFVGLGWLALAWSRASWRAQWRFTAAFAFVALPWYARVWRKTGHPLFNHDFAGWFPVNAIHRDYMRSVADLQGIAADPSTPGILAGSVMLLALLPLALGLGGGLARFRRQGAWLLALLTAVGLWLGSVAQTSGGAIYSLRVLTPAIAVGAALGGILLARCRRPVVVGTFALLITLVAVDASGRSLYLPVDSRVAWWREPIAAWRDFGRFAGNWRRLPVWDAVVEAAADRSVLVTDPVVHALLAGRGARVIPLFSPAARAALDPQRSVAATLRALRQQGVRFICITKRNPVADRWLERYPLFQALPQLPAEADGRLYAVYDLFSEKLIAAAAAR